jgi:microcystin-dependent protein
VLSAGSSVSLRAPSAAEVGKLRIRETTSDYELLFGNPTVTEKNLFSIIVKNDPTSNFYIKNSYSDVDVNAPLWINRTTGEVNIKSLRVNNIKTDPPPGTSPPPGQQENYGDPNRNVLPAGMIVMFPVSGIPNGWLACDGKLHDKRSLPELFNVIGYNYSLVKSGNMFQVPDYRGLFIRGLDYKRGDEPSHTFLDPLSTRPLDGEIQNDDIKEHTHHIDNISEFSCTRSDFYTGVGAMGPVANIATDSRDVVESRSGGLDSDPIGGTETRPKNVVALYCIKW